MLEAKEIVSGYPVTLNAYTEKRRADLDKVNADVDAFVKSLDDTTMWEAIPIEKKAEFWKRKAAILWTFDKQPPADFWTSPEFEYPKLKESERLFMSAQIYL